MSGDLKWNKIAGAGLATVFAILIVNEVASRVYHQEEPEKMGYFIEVAEEEGEGGDAALPTDWGTVLPTADLAAGEATFARCATCHTITQGGANGTGPNLWGVVGRAVASVGGFNYSEAMRGHAGEAPNWTYDELDAFINAPQRHVNGTNMTFGGLRDQAQRANLIAWMRQQGSGGYAVPAPDPARQAGAAPAGAPADGGEAGPDDADALPGGTVVEGTQGAEPSEDPGARGGQAADTPNQELSNPGGPDNRAGRGG